MNNRRKMLLKIRRQKTLDKFTRQNRQHPSNFPQSLKLKRFSTDFDSVVTYLSPILFDNAGHYIIVKKTQGCGRMYVRLPSKKIICHHGLTKNQIRKLIKEVSDSCESLMSLADRYNSTGLLDDEFTDDDWGKMPENESGLPYIA